MSGRHAAPDRRTFYRDLVTMIGGILVVGAIVFGLLSLYSSWRAGQAAENTTSAAVLAGETTTSRATTAAPSTTAAQSTITATTLGSTSTTIVLRAPAEVRVLVLNAVGVSGLAAEVTERLDGLGYQTITPANYQPALEQSRVWYHAGFAPEAFELAGAVAPDALIEENPDLTADADIVVVLGASYEG